MRYRIESGIPIPPLDRKPPAPPFATELQRLRRTQSFLIHDRSLNSVCSYIRLHFGDSNRQYTCRTVDGGVRVWRVL